jgi:hypothetical protein
MVEWARYGFHKKLGEIHYTKPVFLYPLGSAGNVVHSGASNPKMSTRYFSWPGRPGAVSIKRSVRYITLNLFFL